MPKNKNIARKSVKDKQAKTQKAVKPTKAKAVKVVVKPKHTFITFIIDYSGSMDSIRAETIEHVNEQIEEIQAKSKDQIVHISLITFNENVSCQFFNESLGKLKPLTLRTYRPSGSTAMLDAVGYAITRMDAEIAELEKDDQAAALIVIVSDGIENASKTWTRQTLARLIRRKQDTKRWTFTYLGANQDLAIIEEMGIPKGNVSAFVADADGMKVATAMSVQSTRSYLSARDIGETQVKNYYSPK